MPDGSGPSPPQRHARRPDIALVTMPFAPLGQPSLALSLLQATLEPGRAAIHYENLRFAALIGFERYEELTGRAFHSTQLVGEWIFREAAFGTDAERDQRYLTESLTLTDRAGHPVERAEQLRQAVLDCREAVDAYLDEAARRILDTDPLIVGFTSVFQQHVASIALAARLKRQRPDVVVVFGGANCEGPMGRALVRNFHCVDAAVSGDGEIAFAQVVGRVDAGRNPAGVPGVATRHDLPLVGDPAGRRAPTPDLDSLPIPDFSEFFEQWDAAGAPESMRPSLLFESARGCWWGAIRHCTFCGLNGEGMAFRSKSPERAVSELCALAARHPGHAIYAVDNIMDRSYFETFLPLLAASPFDARLFYEVKANLTKAQLQRLVDAGVRDIQPGIESLHDAALRLMAKGVTAIENVQLLKWCAELGVRPYWNVLWGFPGEPVEAFDEMADLVPRISHLRPPEGTGAIRIDRFSPNHERSDEMGFHNVRPVPAYQVVYDLSPAELADLAYFFTADEAELGGAPPPPPLERFQDALETWRDRHDDSDLWMTDRDEVLTIWDTRWGGPPVDRHLTGLARRIYLACDRCVSAPELVELLRSAGEPVAQPEVGETARQLVSDGLMMTDGRRYLALARDLRGRDVPPRFLRQLAFELSDR